MTTPRHRFERDLCPLHGPEGPLRRRQDQPGPGGYCTACEASWWPFPDDAYPGLLLVVTRQSADGVVHCKQTLVPWHSLPDLIADDVLLYHLLEARREVDRSAGQNGSPTR